MGPCVWVSIWVGVWFAIGFGLFLVRIRFGFVFGSCLGACLRIWFVFGPYLDSCSGSYPASRLVRIWFVSDLDLIRVWVGSNSHLS